MADELLLKIVGGTGVIGCLVWIIFYLKAELKQSREDRKADALVTAAIIAAKDAEIKELNLVVRKMQTDSVIAASEMTGVVKNLTELIKAQHP